MSAKRNLKIKQYNVDMFSTRLVSGKAFAAEQQIRNLKKLLLKSRIIEKRDNIKLILIR